MNKQREVARINNGIKILFWLVFVVFFAYSFQTIIDLKYITHPVRQESFIRILTALSNPNFSEGENSRQVVVKMWETILIGFLATTISAVFAIPFTFFSARPSALWGRGFKILVQFIFSAVRAVHPLYTIILPIVLVSMGPTAGVLALTLFSTAVLIGVFSEFAQQHTSLNWSNLIKVYFPGLALKHLPINMLISTVLGFVGGGGIGFLLLQNIGLLHYRDASVAILACIVTIGSLDLLSRAVWHKILNHKASLTSATEIANLD